MPYEALSSKRITEALRRLGELALEKKVTLELSLYGGAVFTLVYGSRETTMDVDAVVRQSELARVLARKVAGEQNLPEDWLNDDVRQFLAEREAKRLLPHSNFGKGLRVLVPTAAYLLAMKLQACRPPIPGYEGDYGDIRFLVGKMQLRTVEEAEALHAKFFPHDELSSRAKEVVRLAIKDQQP